MGIICLILVYSVRNWTQTRINFLLGQIHSGLERIAQVKTKSNEVSRNHTGQLLWQEISSGEIVYVGNSIQTDKNSNTEIIFDEGESVVIGPESLVRFVRAENKILLQMVNGKIEIKSPDVEIKKNLGLAALQPKRLFVATPKGRLILNNSNIRIEAKTEKDFKIEVLSGAPELIRGAKIEVLKIADYSEKIEVLPPNLPLQKIESVKSALPVPPPLAPLPEVVKTTEVPEALPHAPPHVLPESKPPTPRKPAQIKLKAPKVKSIKVEADE